MENIIIIEAQKNLSEIEYNTNEMISLCEAAGGKVVGVCSQLIKVVTPATFIGKGKADEVKILAEETNADLCVFDGELSPSQTLNLSDAIGVPVITKTNLILDIFANRAQSQEGKVLVELAQLKYLYPRLKGKGDSLSRLGAGIGTRGPGETKLETDRRHIRGRILALEKELDKIRSRRKVEYSRRHKNNVKTVALVGYTNVGKSTLLNLLCKSDVLQKDMLFATLDTASRKAYVGGNIIVFIDTVGFIRELPTELLEAFKSTLDCIKEADLVLNVADGSTDWNKQFEVTENILSSLDCSAPIIKVLNKCDVLKDEYVSGELIKISAKNKEGIEKLKSAIIKTLALKNRPNG